MPDQLFDPKTIHVVGWTLIHFTWQASLIGVAVALGKHLLRNHEASWRYGVSGIALLLMAVVAAVTAFTLSTTTASVQPFDSSVSWLESQLPWIYIAWLMGVSGLTLRLAGGWYLIHRLKRLADPVHIGLQSRVDQLRSSLGVRRSVRVFRSALVRVPMVVGWFKPVILIPGSLVTGIPAVELEALLAHELGHIRRYDYLVNGLQTLIETVFFFHPAVWWVSKQVRLEREHCCDDLALIAADKLTYTRALLELEELKGAGLTFTFNGVGVGADGGHLLNRIQRLVTSPESSGSYGSKLISAVALTAMLLGSVHMSEAGRAPMLSHAPDIASLDFTVRVSQLADMSGIAAISETLAPARPTPVREAAGETARTRVNRELVPDLAVAEPVTAVNDGLQAAGPAPPVARSRQEGVWNTHGLPTFVSTSDVSRPLSGHGQHKGQLGFGISGGVIQSSTVGPLSPNLEFRGLYAIDGLTQIEVGVGFSMFLHENLFAYTDAKGEQVQMTTNYEQQFQVSLGVRRASGDDNISGLYYGLGAGLMRLPIHRLIGDADQAQEAYDSKIGYFFLPKVGYVTRINSPFSWDLSAGLSFSRSNGVAFVQPVVSLGMNYWN